MRDRYKVTFEALDVKPKNRLCEKPVFYSEFVLIS